MLCNFIEIALRHGCSSVNLLHIFRTSFPKNTSGGLLLLYKFNALMSGGDQLFCLIMQDLLVQGLIINLNLFKTYNALVFCRQTLAVALPLFGLNRRKELQTLNRSKGKQLQYAQKIEPYTERYRNTEPYQCNVDRHQASQCHSPWFRMFI